MSDLLVAATPDNLRFDGGSLAVEGDVYDICGRLAELSSKTFGNKHRLLMRDRKDSWAKHGGKRYIVSEIGEDGVERWVQGFDTIDGHIIEKLEYMLHVPFEKRFAEAEKLEAKLKAEGEENTLNEYAENVGLPMQRDLERTGFIQRRTSYSKSGHMGGRGSLRRA